MRKLFTVIAIVAISFTAPSAFGEEAVPESRQELAKPAGGDGRLHLRP